MIDPSKTDIFRLALEIAIFVAVVVADAYGVSGWIQEALSGLLLGILFLSTKRNLVVPIVAHGVSNTLAFVLIYLGRYPGLR